MKKLLFLAAACAVLGMGFVACSDLNVDDSNGLKVESLPESCGENIFAGKTFTSNGATLEFTENQLTWKDDEGAESIDSYSYNSEKKEIYFRPYKIRNYDTNELNTYDELVESIKNLDCRAFLEGMWNELEDDEKQKYDNSFETYYAAVIDNFKQEIEIELKMVKKQFSYVTAYKYEVGEDNVVSLTQKYSGVYTANWSRKNADKALYADGDGVFVEDRTGKPAINYDSDYNANGTLSFTSFESEKTFTGTYSVAETEEGVILTVVIAGSEIADGTHTFTFKPNEYTLTPAGTSE